MQWEYLIETIHANDAVERTQEKLTQLGTQRWEVVAVWHQYPMGNGSTLVLFKRPKS